MEAALNGPSGRTTLGPSVLTIGRLPSNSLVVNDSKASSRHAEISPTGSGYSITDLGSTNGTFVNEQRLERNAPRMLNPGDRIRFGDTLFTFEGTSAFQQDPTVYAGEGNSPAYPSTVAAPPPTSYGMGQGYQPPQAYPPPPAAYQPPPAAYPSYIPPGQPAYGVPGYPAAPATPGRPRTNRNLLIGLGAGVAVLVVVLIVLFAFVLPSTPTKTLDTFCNALKVPDYQTAYNQFSSRIQAQGSEASFASSFGQAQINSCTHGSPSESGDNATSSITFFAATAPGTPVTGTVSLIKENGTWKINNLNIPNSTGRAG